MERPDTRHVRIREGRVWIERVPNYWVDVCEASWFESFTEHEKAYMIEKALKHGHEKEWPPNEVPGQ